METSGTHILIVDDEADFRETLKKRFTYRKLQVQVAESGPQAVELLQAGGVEVVILDVRMPGGMDGLQVLREIRSRHPDVEVILLTGHASIESGVQGMSLGAFDYMLKPVDFDALLDKVRQAAQHRQLRRA